jgi:hypothetical protein
MFLFGGSRQPEAIALLITMPSITGLYVALFGTCLHFLLRNSQSSQKVILSAITIMFSLAAADVVWTISLLYACILAERPTSDDDGDGKPEIPASILQYKFLLYITSK